MNKSWLHLQIVRTHEPFWCELTSGFAILGWGLYSSFVGLPLDSLPAYDVLTEHVPDWTWCWISIVCGILQIAAAAFEFRRTRQVMAFIMLVIWKVLAVSIFKSGVTSPASMVYCALAIGNIPTFWMLRSGARAQLRA